MTSLLVALVLRVSDAARRPAAEKGRPEPGVVPTPPRTPLAEAHTEMVSRSEVATPPHGHSPPTPPRGRTRGE